MGQLGDEDRKPLLRKELRDFVLVFVTAMVTALGTTSGKDWLPKLYDRLTQQPILIIQVESERQPVSGVLFTVSAVNSEEVIATGITGEAGIARLKPIPRGKIAVDGVLREGQRERRYVKIHTIDSLPYDLILERDEHFSLPQAVGAAIAPSAPPPAPSRPPNQVLLVQVKRGRQPVAGVSMDIRGVTGEEVIAAGTTNDSGLTWLSGVPTGMIIVEGVLREGQSTQRYVGIHTIESLPDELVLDIDEEFSPPQVLVATATPSSPTPAPEPTPSPTAAQALVVQYGQPLLPTDREADALLEIDWIEGTPRPELQVEISDGRVIHIQDILREVGINLEVRWSQGLPYSVMGPDGGFNQEELLTTMASYRDSDVSPDKWHFYLIYGGKHEQGPGIQSIMFDTSQRRGAAVFTEARDAQPEEILFETIHETGHMLNLPHPFQAYGDTKSVMSFPHRWIDWSWDEPDAYRFDDFGQQHIRRAPDEYVRPGGSAFLDYGGPTPWEEFEK